MDYFIKVNITLAIFYCFYMLVLRQSVYFTANRAFLISGMVLAFIIPAFNLPGGNYLAGIRDLPAEASLNAVFLDPVQITAEHSALPILSPLQWLGLTYAFIATVFLFKILFSLYRILQLYRHYPVLQYNGYRLVLLENDREPAFSFFSIIFINRTDLHQADNWIVRHELAHARQFHSLDILLSELLKAVLWANPFVYLYQRSIRSVNEYLADAIIKPEEKSRYAELMYEYSFHSRQTSLQNSFFNKTLLKRRIKMLHRKRSKKMRLAYLLIVPLLVGLVFTVSKAGNTGQTAENRAVIFDVIKGSGESRGSGNSGGLGAAEISGKSANPGQLVTVTGKVTDMMNDPLPGASIFVKETPHGTATNMKGYFELKDIPADARLQFKMIGYETITINLNNNRVVNVRLERKKQRLDEMVVVGYPGPGASEEKSGGKMEEPKVVIGKPKPNEEKIYSFASVEKMPEFPGGKEALFAHIAKEFRYPKAAKKGRIEGTVEIGFVVDEKGNVTHPEVVKGIGGGCDEEAVRVVKTLPKWEPGEQNGVKVAVYYVLPMVLKLD